MGKRKRMQPNQPMVWGSKQSFCQVRNEKDTATIYIYDEIGGWGIWADELIAQLARITASTIIVRVDTPGGFVGHAIAMHNALRKHPATIITEVDNQAASAGSFLIQAGDIRRIAANAHLMIHDIQGGVKGSEQAIRDYADHMPVMRDAIVATYAYRTTIDEQEIRDMLASGKDIYLNAEQALAMGFVDEIQSLEDMSPSTPSTNSGVANQGSFDVGQAKQAAGELQQIYATQPNKQNKQNEKNKRAKKSDGTRSRDYGKGEVMNKKELIAKLKDVGVDVSALETQAAATAQAQADLSTAQTSLDTFNALIGERSHDEVKAALDAADAQKAELIDSIVASRRALKQIGDTEAETAQAQATYATFNMAQLEALATPLQAAAKSKEDFVKDASDADETGNPYYQEQGAK